MVKLGVTVTLGYMAHSLDFVPFYLEFSGEIECILNEDNLVPKDITLRMIKTLRESLFQTLI